MLTIQPNLTTRQFTQKPLHFKGQEPEITEDYVRRQQAFYEGQMLEADKIIENKKAPEALKKGMRLSKIISAGVLEGWAVLWGATVGAKHLKGGAIKAFDSKAAKKLASGAKRAGEFIATNMESIGKSKVGKKVAEWIERLNDTKYGKYIVSAGKAVVNAVKAVIGFIKKGFDKLKGTDIESAYDKTAKGAATTLGVGSGVAGSYSAAKKTAAENGEDTVNEDIFDFDDEDLEGPGD